MLGPPKMTTNNRNEQNLIVPISAFIRVPISLACVRKRLRNRPLRDRWPSIRQQCDSVVTFPDRSSTLFPPGRPVQIQANRSTCRRHVLRRSCALSKSRHQGWLQWPCIPARVPTLIVPPKVRYLKLESFSAQPPRSLRLCGLVYFKYIFTAETQRTRRLRRVEARDSSLLLFFPRDTRRQRFVLRQLEL